MNMKTYYKLARPDGFDFYTGKTINYRNGIGKTILCPGGDKTKGICSNGVIHASLDINDAVRYAKLPFSAYIIQGTPVVTQDDKCGFLKIDIVSEIIDIDTVCGWRYTETINPINPLKLKSTVTKADIELLKEHASVWASVWASVRASVYTYIGHFFPNITKWKYIEHKEGEYPYQSCVDLWMRGFVPSFDGKIWRLHAGANAKVVYTL
jgi:hypothetical protein